MALTSSKIDEIFLCCLVYFSNQFLSMIINIYKLHRKLSVLNYSKLYIRGTRHREFIDFDYYMEYIEISQFVEQSPCLFIVNTLQ